MQKADTVLNIYRKRGSKGLPLERVYRHRFDQELFLRAYGKIYRNFGAMTKGSTEETVDGMSLQKIQGIIDLLRHERYPWTPVRRVVIPKANGKTRPLGIPTWSDKLVQEALRTLLEPYYEQRFGNHSHGFRPNRNCHTALQLLLYGDQRGQPPQDGGYQVDSGDLPDENACEQVQVQGVQHLQQIPGVYP